MIFFFKYKFKFFWLSVPLMKRCKSQAGNEAEGRGRNMKLWLQHWENQESSKEKNILLNFTRQFVCNFFQICIFL